MMNINRHNYEEFFLLYVDGELSAAERSNVEAFVQQHPDLKMELDMLLQTKLLPEEELNFDKSFLFKSETYAINSTNYEEQFLLYIDEELSINEKAAVETFVLQHPQFQDEFTLLKQTKLEQEIIAYPNKKELYRKEENRKPVVFMNFARLAIAAAIIGVGILLWSIIPSNKIEQAGNSNTLAKAGYPSQTQHQNNIDKRNNSLPQNNVVENKGLDKDQLANVSNSEKNRQAKTVITNAAVKQNKAQPTLVNNNAGNTVAVNKPSNNLPVPEVQNVANSTELIAANNNVKTPSSTNNNNVAAANNDAIAAQQLTANNNANNNNYVQHAVYKELDTDANDDKKSLYVGNIELNKDKLRGLARKMGRLFGKAKTAVEEDKTVIARNL
jgi:hypothetical protein